MTALSSALCIVYMKYNYLQGEGWCEDRCKASVMVNVMAVFTGQSSGGGEKHSLQINPELFF